jgi:hypothetical protein
MHKVGSVMLEELLNSDNGGFDSKIISDKKGNKYNFKEFRNKEVLTVLGTINLQRAYYYNKENKKGYFPKDILLNLCGTSFSPGIKRIMCRVGAYRPFNLGHEDIKEMAGIEVGAKEIERISYQIGLDVEKYNKSELSEPPVIKQEFKKDIEKMYVLFDGTGVPVVKEETKGRKGKGENGQAKTREAKLGCVFTQTKTDKDGYPVRDEGSTSYVGYIETAEDFGSRIYDEADYRGLDRAKKVCVIGDGAKWIWNIADYYFPNAIQIIDIYHAREHYWSVAKKIFLNDKDKIKTWTAERSNELNAGHVEKVIFAIKKLLGKNNEQNEEIERQVGYFENNKERMRYKIFRLQGLFIGSGVIEAGCKSVIGQRLKQSGMHWTVFGANNIIALRCSMVSNRWEDYWEYRATA